MKPTAHWMPVLSLLAALIVASPALAKQGGNGKGHAYGHAKGHGKGHAYGHANGKSNSGASGQSGGSKGSPAPIAGLGILALGAIGYGTRRLQRPSQK